MINANQWQVLRKVLGIPLLKYMLNVDDDIDRNITLMLNSRNLSNNEQLKVVKDIYDAIKKIRCEAVSNDSDLTFVFGDYGISEYCYEIRKKCSGTVHEPNVPNNDLLLKILLDAAIKLYPDLLLWNSYDQYDYFRYRYAFCSRKQMNELEVALGSDEILSKIFERTESSEGSYVSFETYAGAVKAQLFAISNNILNQAFRNVCYRMSYDLEQYLKEVSGLVESLRGYANKDKIRAPIFIGIKGLSIPSCFKGPIKNGELKIYPSISKDHPLIKSSGANKHYPWSDCVLEVAVQEEKISHELIDDILMKIQLAAFFAKSGFDNSMGFDMSFWDYGFPYSLGCTTRGGRYTKKMTLAENEVGDFIVWFDKLSRAEVWDHIGVSLRRLRDAIFYRTRDDDAVIDAVIAWEALFGSKSEIASKVCTSIAGLLGGKNAVQREKYEASKRLYGLRCDLVHGNKKNLEKRLKRNKNYLLEARFNSIKTAGDCLKKLLAPNNNDLLKMTSSARIVRLGTNLPSRYFLMRLFSMFVLWFWPKSLIRLQD